jgi:hypothetical protein
LPQVSDFPQMLHDFLKGWFKKCMHFSVLYIS